MLLNLVLGLVVGGIILWVIFRLLTSAAVWVARSVWNIDIKIRQVGIFMLGKITLNLRPGLRIDVERLWLSSSYINGDIKKPLAICLGEARVQIEPKPRSQASREDGSPDPGPTLQERRRKLYKWLGWAQHVCVSFDNVHVIFVHLVTTDCLTHNSIQEIEAHLTLTDNWLEIYFSADNLTSKVLKSIIPQFQGSDDGPCLAELALSASVRLAVDLDDLSLQIVETSLKKSHLRFSDGAFLELEALVRKQKSNSISRLDAAENLDVTDDPSTTLSILNRFIPKEIHFHSEDFRFIVSKESGRRKVQLSIQDINFDLAQSLHSGMVVGNVLLAVRELVLASQINLVNLGYLELKAEGKEKTVSSSCILRSCFVGYHYEEIQYWVGVAMRLQLPSNTQITTGSPQRKTSMTSVKRILAQLRHRTVSMALDFDDGSIMAATETCAGVKAGLNHLKVTSSMQFASDQDSTFLQTLKWELELQSVYCKMTEGGAPSAELSAKLHHWGTVFYLGMLIVKARKLAQELTLDTMLDSVQFEWSAQFASTLTTAAVILQRKQLPSAMKPNIPVEKAPTNIDQLAGTKPGLLSTLLSQAQINVQCSNINIYILNELKVGVLFRNDSLAIQQRTSAELMITCHGNKLAYFHQKNRTHNVVRCHDLQNFSGYMKKVDISYKQIKHEVGFKVSEEFFFHWATALHMVLFEAGQMVKEVTTAFKAIKPAGPDSPSPYAARPPSQQASHKKPLNFAFSIRALCNIVIKLSKEHRISLKTDHASIAQRSNRTTAKLEQLDILFDEHKIFNIKGLCVESSDNNGILKVERQGFDTLQLPVNKSWTIELEKLEIVFPHGYNFAAGFEEAVNLNKWRKLVHHVKKPAFTADSPLPPDLNIKIKSFVMVVCDDPFEVKLGDNYELLVDEYHENEKRWAAMENRIEELRKKFTLLPASKIEELYVSLHKKSAEVYIHRSGQLYSATPMRHKLFTWTLDNLEIIAMADPTLHGKENVVTHMKEIDPESPYPEEGLEYTTLWCRQVHVSADCWRFKLRDYPTPWLDIQDLHIWGRLIGAEPKPSKRAVRSCVVEVSSPWDDVKVQRFMPALKYYHDFSCDVSRLTMAYGPCWDPIVSEFNLGLNLINRPSVDPSQPLPFWDKFRLLFHGRLTMSVQKMRWLYHASMNPNNTTEFMDWTWTNLILDWTNAKWVLRGDLDIYSRTASKYDDCRFLHLPNLRFCLHLEWVTSGDCNDHHSVQPCAPDKVPEYSLQEHDSYRAFRSERCNFSLSLVTKPNEDQSHHKPTLPSCIFYASTRRWIDKITMCMGSVSRPIRRGKMFSRVQPRKVQLSRHIRNLNLSVNVHEFKVCHWVSFAKQLGMEMLGKQFSLDIGTQMTLSERDDGLCHRDVTAWSIDSFTSTLHQSTIWLISADKAEEASFVRRALNQRITTMAADVLRMASEALQDIQDKIPALKRNVSHTYFLSIENLTYERDGPANPDDTASSVQSEAEEKPPTHKVVLTSLRLAWTPNNRNIILNLLDMLDKSQVLQKNLAADALKGFKVDLATTSKSRSSSNPNPNITLNTSSAAPSPLAKLQHSMLQKLVSEADSRFVAVSEEVTGGSVEMDQLHGIAACQTSDVVDTNCHIVLHNSQVLLRGVETQGYVIVSASRAVIRSRTHVPVWQGRQLKSKTTWVGKIEVMQYYATMGMEGADDNDICWVSAANVSDIHEEQGSVSPTAGLSGYGIEAIPDHISTDRSVGGVIVDTSSGTEDMAGQKVQLQRIISRCSCDVFYASYGEVSPETICEVPPPPSESSDMMQEAEGADSFTLLHHDLNICTNPAQYERIMDIVNNLLLYVEPHKKEAHDKLQNMRFKFALSNMEDMRTPILDRQNSLRDMVSWLRHKERAIYLIQKTLEDEPNNVELQSQSLELSEQLEECKLEINAAAEELASLISCYKESQLQIKAAVKSKGKQAPIARRHEICFTHAEWRMTEVDGQIGIADLVLRNFLYTKVNREDDSGIHQLELGWVRVTNLIPNTPYKDVLIPQETGESNHQMALRIQCRFKAPVGGISIREHFEVNVIPMSIQLTHRFYRTVMAFFFPGKKIDEEQADDPESDTKSEAGVSSSTSSTSLATMSAGSSRTSRKKQSSRKMGAHDIPVDDIDKMKERAAENNMFLYIKIPEVDLRVSYKGSKDKNLIDVQNIQLQLPTLQYHNETWTWFDFLMAIKKDSRKALIGQAIKQKLHMKSKTGDDTAKTDIQQDDKTRLLFGAKLTSVGEKSTSKKSLFGKSSHK